MGSKRGIRRRHMPGILANMNRVKTAQAESEAARREIRKMRAALDKNHPQIKDWLASIERDNALPFQPEADLICSPKFAETLQEIPGLVAVVSPEELELKGYPEGSRIVILNPTKKES